MLYDINQKETQGQGSPGTGGADRVPAPGISPAAAVERTNLWDAISGGHRLCREK